MIRLTHYDGIAIFVNPSQVETVQPDGHTKEVIVSLISGTRFCVQESAQEVVELVEDALLEAKDD